jgi:hypothetical protein
MSLVKSLYGGDPNVICLGASAASSKEKAKSVQLFGLHPSAVHVCSYTAYSCSTCTGRSHVEGLCTCSK